MVDSGASCNFIGLTLFRTLGLNLENCVERQVRLADGKMLTTCGEAMVRINFGDCEYWGHFKVLPHDIPPILGMKFLSEFGPKIDFVARKVEKCDARGCKPLKVVRFEQARAQARAQNVVLKTENRFEGLQEQGSSNAAGCNLDDKIV